MNVRNASILLMLSALLCAGQEKRSDWQNLGQLPQGAKLTLDRWHNTEIRGRLVDWQPGRVTIARGTGEPIVVKQADVRNAYVKAKGSRKRNALFGALVGFVPAFALGAASAGSIMDQNNPAVSDRMGVGLVFGGVFAGIGAAVGALTGGTKEELVYRSTDENKR